MSHDDHVPPFPKTYPKGITYEETLRDQFAMAALPACIARIMGSVSSIESMVLAADIAYRYADAMMKERGRAK